VRAVCSAGRILSGAGLYSVARVCYNDAMPDDSNVPISNSLRIPAEELSFRFSRAGGPGGQHVNRSATQVELLFDVAHSPTLTEDQRERIQAALANRIDQEGVLHLFSSGTRSQHRNRQEVVARFQGLLRRALHVARPRRPTRPTEASRQERLRTKRRRGEIKQRRGLVRAEE
jgi:ribosome-associated protein